jgi:hypothetical protein
MMITNGGSRLSIVGMITEKRQETAYITDDNELQQYKQEIDAATMANVNETQRHESLPIESATHERKKKKELSGIRWILLCLD